MMPSISSATCGLRPSLQFSFSSGIGGLHEFTNTRPGGCWRGASSCSPGRTRYAPAGRLYGAGDGRGDTSQQRTTCRPPSVTQGEVGRTGAADADKRGRRQHTAMIWATKLVFVAEGSPATPSGTAVPGDLLALAMARPHDALARARGIIAGRPSAVEAMIAHQAAGIVLREIDDVGAGIRELRRALRLARQLRRPDHEADVLGSLGVAFVYANRTADGLAAFDRAIQISGGVLLGRVLHRRGHVLWTLGRHAAALEDFRQAVAVLQRAGDQTWAARALNGRGLVYLAVGAPARADADFVAAAQLLAVTGQELMWATRYLTGAWLRSDLAICRLPCRFSIRRPPGIAPWTSGPVLRQPRPMRCAAGRWTGRRGIG